MKTLKLLLLLTAVGCQHDDSKDCLDPAKKKDVACYKIYAPVCGCDGKTYGNDCEASAAGVNRWTKGACQ